MNPKAYFLPDITAFRSRSVNNIHSHWKLAIGLYVGIDVISFGTSFIFTAIAARGINGAPAWR